jgi:hypothetical protein
MNPVLINIIVFCSLILPGTSDIITALAEEPVKETDFKLNFSSHFVLDFCWKMKYNSLQVKKCLVPA